MASKKLLQTLNMRMRVVTTALTSYAHSKALLLSAVVPIIVKTITGLFPLTITDAIGGNALDYSIEGNMGRFVKVGEMMYPIPDGYTVIDHIVLDGNSYFDIGINPSNKKIGAVIDFQFTNATATSGGIFGSNKTDGTDNCQFTVYQSKWRTKINAFAHYGANYDTARHTVRFNMADGTKLDDTVVTETQYTIASSNDVSLLLGACSYNGSPSDYTFIGKLYPSKIYDFTTDANGILVRNFVPMINSSNVIGLYDFVSNTFFTNAGTGNLTAGKTTKTVEVGGETIEVPLFSYDMVGDKTANLFNKDNSAILNSFMIHNATVSGNNDNRGFSLKLTEGETYTVAKSNKGRVYIGASVNPFVIGTNDHLPLLVQNSSTSSATFTVPAGKPYIDIVYWHRTNDAGYTESDIRDTLMLVPGSTAPTSHIPYGFEIPITVGQNSPNLLNMEDVYDCGEYEQSIMSDGSLSTDSRNQGLSPWGIGDYEDPTKTTSIMRRMFDRAGTYYVSLIFNEGGVVPSHWTEESPLSCCRFEIEAEDDWFEKYADPTTGSFELTASEITAIQNSTVYFVSVLVHQVTYNANNQANFHIMITRDGVHNEYIPYGGSSETTYKVITQRQLAKVGTYADKASLLNGGEFKVGVTTLSAGTHTLADAKSNGAYITNIPSSGTLSGTSITIPSGYGNVTVVYELATEESEQITAPNITLAEGTNVIDCETEVKPSNGSITYNA